MERPNRLLTNHSMGDLVRQKKCRHSPDFLTSECSLLRLGTDKEDKGMVGVKGKVWAARWTRVLLTETEI